MSIITQYRSSVHLSFSINIVMHIRDILLELDSRKAAVIYGPQLIQRYYGNEAILKYKMPEAELSAYIIRQLAKKDPTTNLKYLTWIIREYIQGRIDLGHDYDDGHDNDGLYRLLRKFDEAKKKNKIKPQLRDINKFTIDQFKRLGKVINSKEQRDYVNFRNAFFNTVVPDLKKTAHESLRQALIEANQSLENQDFEHFYDLMQTCRNIKQIIVRMDSQSLIHDIRSPSNPIFQLINKAVRKVSPNIEGLSRPDGGIDYGWWFSNIIKNGKKGTHYQKVLTNLRQILLFTPNHWR